MKSIFVSIASYRDADVQNTINDLFAKAQDPSRVFVGVCLQVDPKYDEDCFVTLRPNVSVITIDAKNAKGAGYARSQAQKLWNGEDFFFQVDSHMRFVKDWDTKLIVMHSECLSEKSVLSTYPLPFTPPATFNDDRYVVIKPKAFDVDGVLLQNSGMFPFNGQKLERNPFISAGMLFAESHIIEEVPYDPYIPFTGEEIALGLRLFTDGYDVYVPNKVIAYHNYNPAPERPRIWQDKAAHDEISRIGRARVRWLCGQTVKETDSNVTRRMDTFGLGYQRSLAQYEEFAQLDFKNRTWKGEKNWP